MWMSINGKVAETLRARGPYIRPRQGLPSLWSCASPTPRMGDESSAVAQPQQADAHSLEEAQQKRPLLVVLGCIYRERKNELRQGIASFTKLPPTFNNTHDTFILVCADGALSQQGGASVQAVARKYMRLIGETWKGRDEAQRAFWEDDSRVQVTWFGAVKCGTLPLSALLSRRAHVAATHTE